MNSGRRPAYRLTQIRSQGAMIARANSLIRCFVAEGAMATSRRLSALVCLSVIVPAIAIAEAIR